MAKRVDFLKRMSVKRQVAVLDGELRVVLYERPNMPIGIRAAFKSGSRYDPVGKEGLSHFVEHMIVAGTKKYPSKDILAQFIERYGGVFEATTSSEMLSVNVHITEVADLPKAAQLLDEMLNHSMLDEVIFTTERGSVLRELGNRLSSPANSLWDMYNGLLYQGSKIGRSVLGSEKSINAITLADVKHFIDTYLTADRLTLFVVGDAKMSDISKAFEALKLRRAKAVREVPQTKVVRNRTTEVKHFSINDQIDFLLGFRTCGFNSDDEVALCIIQTVLGGGRAATLMRKLRYEKGYIYSGGALNHMWKNEGVWLYKTACSKKDFQETLDIITTEVRRVYQGKLKQEEVNFAKEKLLKSLRMNLQTTHEWLEYFANQEALVVDLNPGKRISDIANVTQAALQRVGKKYFKPGTWYLAVAGDISEDEFTVNY